MLGKSNRTLPIALVVGPMKSGTSWIHDYLEARGDICLPHLVKETYYFDRFHSRGIDWYSERFSHFDASKHAAIVEVAPSLFHLSRTLPNSIRSELGDIPILIAHRDPVERAWSHYQHMRRGHTRKRFSDAIVEYPEIVDASRYDTHVPNWRAAFSSVTVLDQATLAENPRAYADSVAGALNLQAMRIEVLEGKRSNAATQPRSFLLARVGRRVSDALRKAGMYRIVDFAKKLGLKQIFYGAEARKHALTTEQRDFIKQILG